MTRGPCILGKMEHYVGMTAASERQSYLYLDTNFCSDPEAICTHARTNELRWVIGMLEWTERVQTYDSDAGFNYMDEVNGYTLLQCELCPFMI